MGNPAPVATHVDADILPLIERSARDRGLTSAEYLAKAITRTAEGDEKLRAFIQAGADAIDRGDVVAHDDVMAELAAMIARQRDRCRT